MRKGGSGYWLTQKDKIIDMYFIQGMSTEEIGAIYGFNKSTIGYAIKRFGLRLRQVGSNDRPNAIHTLNPTYFDKIDTEEKAYVLGFILADGHISKRNALMVTVAKKDKDIIDKIQTAIRSNHKIQEKEETASYGFSATSKYMCDRLRSYGISNQKTIDLRMETILPHVPDSLVRHMVRGLFDGNGSVGSYFYPYFPKASVVIQYTGNANVSSFIKGVWGLTIKTMREKQTQSFTVKTSCRADCVRIGHYMYDGATIYLDRKLKKINEIYRLVDEKR